MKIFRYTHLALGFLFLFFVVSCNKGNNEFGVADTFTVDTINVSPSVDIVKDFEIGWAVTTTGYPAFFVKLYLSNDNQLDTLSDIKITECGSADIYPDLNKSEETQFYYIAPVAGSNNLVTIFHNEKTGDVNAAGWEQSKSFANPTGTTKYIIGYFYNTPGLQIQYGRRILAVPVSFK